MLKRRQRLQDRERFQRVRRDGATHSHPLLILCLLPNQGVISRAGITASRRVGKAVDRNRARRRIGAALRQLWQQVVPGWDMVWVARPGINEAEFSEIVSACARLLRRAQLLRLPDEPVALGPSQGTAGQVSGDHLRDAG